MMTEEGLKTALAGLSQTTRALMYDELCRAITETMHEKNKTLNDDGITFMLTKDVVALAELKIAVQEVSKEFAEICQKSPTT